MNKEMFCQEHVGYLVQNHREIVYSIHVSMGDLNINMV